MSLLPAASLSDVVSGRSPLIGARIDPSAPRGFVSPIEPRLHLGLAYGDLAEQERALLAAPSGAKVVLKALLTRLLAAPSQRVPRPRLIAARVDNVEIEDALERLLAPGPRDRAFVAHFVHPHALNLACGDGQLQRDLAEADLVLPDGIGLRIAARIIGTPLVHNVNGTDLLPLLARGLAQRGRTLALFGAAPGVARACADALLREHPALRVGPIEHGFAERAAIDRFVAQCHEQDQPVILVGLGSPLQERFARAELAAIPGATVITVGGLFDFFSGRMPRAPLAMRESGLEWLFRLMQEPRRMARRYLLGNPLFLARALRQRLSTSREPPTEVRPSTA